MAGWIAISRQARQRWSVRFFFREKPAPLLRLQLGWGTFVAGLGAAMLVMNFTLMTEQTTGVGEAADFF